MANPDDKIKDTSQLSKQESTAKKTQKVNMLFCFIFKSFFCYLGGKEKWCTYLSIWRKV